MANTSRLTLVAITLGVILLLLSNNARSTHAVVRVPAPASNGRGVLGHVEFDLLEFNGEDLPPPPAATTPLVSPPPPPPPPASMSLVSLQPATTSSPHKACAPGCEVHGTCNHELGRCDCPAMRSGEACEYNMVPSCRRLWGMELYMPPCQAFAEEKFDYRDFPPTCECLAECHALNLRVVYVDNCVNVSQKELVRGGGPWEKGKSGDDVVPHPWRDVFGDGKWLRQAYKPGRRDVQLTEQQLTEKNLALAGRLYRDAAETTRLGKCSGRGLWTVPMPWWGIVRMNQGPVCHCHPGWYGEDCEFGPGDLGAPAGKQYCVHDCEGRGVCKLNFCHCVPGTWGIDCGFGEPDAQLAKKTAYSQRTINMSKPHGWTTQMLSTPKPTLPVGKPGLRIYVYDLPPRNSVWFAAHFRRTGRWDQSYLYSLDAKMHRWLLRSPYRTLDPEHADYFFVPLYLSLGFYDFEFGLYWLTNRGHQFMRQAFDEVRRIGPWYDRKRGADHFLVMTNDKGACFIRGSVPALEKMTLVTQWGWVRPHIHRPEYDVVVPPMLKVDKLIAESPFMGDAMQSTRTWLAQSSAGYQYLLSFVGSVRFHTPGYSMGVRQKIFRAYNASPSFFLRDLRGDSRQGPHKALDPLEYLRVLRASKFCLAPSGMGFSTRTYESMAQGCVPLVIQDEPVSNTTVDQAFASLLPWHEFSYRLKQSDIPNLPKLLQDFPDAEWRRLRRNLACAWPRVLWLQADNEAPGFQTVAESKSADATSKLGSQGYLSGYDAFESVMHTLARKAAARKGLMPPSFGWRTPALSCKVASEGTEVGPLDKATAAVSTGSMIAQQGSALAWSGHLERASLVRARLAAR